MNYVCVIDGSLPPYAAPLARECVATVLLPATPTGSSEAVQLLVAGAGLAVGFGMLAYGLWRAVRMMVSL